MTKIMLVEDDNNLREIYEARLAAEGFEIVSAEDGESALAIAAKEKPQLVITDVMMPKISGFEMLDILRNTDALRQVKVIMLTALSQAEDNARAGKLGADRYLVKSQVTLEDIVKAAHELLEGKPAEAAPAVAATDTTTDTSTDDTTDDDKKDDASVEPAATTEIAPATPAPVAESPTEPAVADPVTESATEPATEPTPEPAPAPVIDVAEPPAADDSADTSTDTTVDATTTDTTAEPQTDEVKPEEVTSDDDVLEQAKAATEAEIANAQTASEEESDLKSQIDQFLTDSSATPPSDKPAEAAATEQPTEEVADTSSEGATDVNLDTNLGGQNLFSAPPADESEDEYAKDDATPDMGNLSVRDAAAASEPASSEQVASPTPPAPEPTPPAVPAPAPEPPSAPLAEPAVAEPVTESATPPAPEPAPAPPAVQATPGELPAPVSQTSGDKVVSSAIDSMMAASTTHSRQPTETLPPSEAWKQKENEPSAPIMDTPAAGLEPDPTDLPSSAARPIAPEEHPAPAPDAPSPAAQTTRVPKKVIAPLNHGDKPDIQQLLSIEEAKNGALQAAQTIGMPPIPQPRPQPSPQVQGQQQAPSQPPQTPPAMGGLDPNAVAL